MDNFIYDIYKKCNRQCEDCPIKDTFSASICIKLMDYLESLEIKIKRNQYRASGFEEIPEVFKTKIFENEISRLLCILKYDDSPRKIVKEIYGDDCEDAKEEQIIYSKYKYAVRKFCVDENNIPKRFEKYLNSVCISSYSDEQIECWIKLAVIWETENWDKCYQDFINKKIKCNSYSITNAVLKQVKGVSMSTFNMNLKHFGSKEFFSSYDIKTITGKSKISEKRFFEIIKKAKELTQGNNC